MKTYAMITLAIMMLVLTSLNAIAADSVYTRQSPTGEAVIWTSASTSVLINVTSDQALAYGRVFAEVAGANTTLFNDTDMGTEFSATVDITGTLSDGTITLYIETNESTMNVTGFGAYELDETAPTVNSIVSSEGNETHNTVTTLTFATNDALATCSYDHNNIAYASMANALGTGTSLTATFYLVNGPNTVYSRCTDDHGNVATTSQSLIVQKIGTSNAGAAYAVISGAAETGKASGAIPLDISGSSTGSGNGIPSWLLLLVVVGILYFVLKKKGRK
jgi:hypothetical protein